MGLSASAKLIWGIVLELEYDDNYSQKPAVWFDKENGIVDLVDLVSQDLDNPYEDPEFESIADKPHPVYVQWKNEHPEWCKKQDQYFEARRERERFLPVEIISWGHYDDPDGPRAILTIKGLPTFGGDCWTAGQIDPLAIPFTWNSACMTANKFCREHGLPEFTATNSRWWLVANYG